MSGFIPGVPNDSLGEFIGLIGAVIMPHNLFLHSSLVQSRNVDSNNKTQVKEANKYVLVTFLIIFESFVNCSSVNDYYL